jgi:hypothetical protein
MRILLNCTNAPAREFPSYIPQRLCIRLNTALLSQPGWELQLRRAFDAISAVCQPFYGEMRVWAGWGADDAPVNSFEPLGITWKGLPCHPPQTYVVGEPYLSVWPEAGFGIHSGEVVVHGESLGSEVGNMPKFPAALCQEFDPYCQMVTWEQLSPAIRDKVPWNWVPLAGPVYPENVVPTHRPAVWPFSTES